MLNHIHLVAVPKELESLAVCLRRTHGRYAQYLNARRLRCGHLWPNRFCSCPMDNEHLWTALRYVELNPVRAGLAEKAEDFAWSSAPAHRSGKDSTRILDMDFWLRAGGVQRWVELLAGAGDEAETNRLRAATFGVNSPKLHRRCRVTVAYSSHLRWEHKYQCLRRAA